MGREFTSRALRNARFIAHRSCFPFWWQACASASGFRGRSRSRPGNLLGGDRGLGDPVNIALQEQNTARILAASLIIVLFVRLVDYYGFEPLQRRLTEAYRRA